MQIHIRETALRVMQTYGEWIARDVNHARGQRNHWLARRNARDMCARAFVAAAGVNGARGGGGGLVDGALRGEHLDSGRRQVGPQTAALGLNAHADECRRV